MTGTPTPKWGFPTYDGTEPGSLKTVANAQANAAEAAMNNAASGFFLRYATKALLTANTTAVGNQHATVYADPTVTNNGDWVYNGTAWVRNPIVQTALITFSGIYSAGTPAPQLVIQGARVFAEGVIASTTAAFVSGTEYTVGSIPSTVWPSIERIFACMANGTAVFGVKFKIDGTVTITPNTGFTGALGLSLNGSWRI